MHASRTSVNSLIHKSFQIFLNIINRAPDFSVILVKIRFSKIKGVINFPQKFGVKIFQTFRNFCEPINVRLVNGSVKVKDFHDLNNLQKIILSINPAKILNVANLTLFSRSQNCSNRPKILFTDKLNLFPSGLSASSALVDS